MTDTDRPLKRTGTTQRLAKPLSELRAERATTKIRRAPVEDDLGCVSTADRVVKLFCTGRSPAEISTEIGWSIASVKSTVSKHFTTLRDLLLTESLIDSQKADQVSISRTSAKIGAYKKQQLLDKDINKLFLEKLSDPDDDLLTTQEVNFCYLMVHEGDELKALVDSGLDEGLSKSNKGCRRALRLRCLMLKGKKNIIRYISGLQVDYAKELNLNKEAIQTEIITQLNQLKEQNNPKNAPTIAKLTDQLGRTVGAFTDKIEISEVSFDDAMNEMLNMRKAKVAEIEKKEGAKAAEVYVYDPSKIG